MTNKIQNPGQCTDEEREKPPPSDSSTGTSDSSTSKYDYDICRQIPDKSGDRSKCESCLSPGSGGKSGIWTAVGCIRADAQSITKAVVEVGLGIAGGISILNSLAAGFMLSISQGDPKRTGEAKDMLTASIIGILFTVFSVSLLQFIGVDILRLPGFGG